MDRELLIENDRNSKPSKSFFRLVYKYSTCWEKILLLFGIICSILTGCSNPYLCYCFGIITSSLVKITSALRNETISPEELDRDFEVFNSDMNNVSLNFFLCGMCYLVFGLFQASTFHYFGEKVMFRIRNAYIMRILRKDIVFFDKTPTGELSSILNDNMERLRETVNEKCALILQYITEFTTGFAISFYLDWRLSCYGTLFSIAIVGSGVINSTSMAKLTSKQSHFYSKAASIALQALSSFKTVISLNGQANELQNYENTLILGEKHGIKRAFYFGISRSVQYLFINALSFALMYVGTTMIYEGTCTPLKVMQLFNTLLFGSFALAEAFPHISLFRNSLASAKPIVDIISTVDEDDIENSMNRCLPHINGKITFENVKFAYPTRPDIDVLQDINFEINAGECIAIVGASGSGKSSIIQLLLHYYDVKSGTVKIDDCPIENMNLEQLRDTIGVVSQEPMLFNTSIEENLRFGKYNATFTEMNEALKMANAYNFVSKLPNKLNTIVGERGSQLSGGQKQRIAIARTLLRNPKILLLDEATSALDNESEHLVQKSLEAASEGRTTIVVAHRLSTIRNANKIIVMDKGKIVETGDHNSLIELGGVYASLIEAQMLESLDMEEAGMFGRQLSEKHDEEISDVENIEEDKDVDEMERLTKELAEENITKSNMLEILKQCKPNAIMLIVAFITSFAQSVCYPLLAQLIANVNEAYAMKNDDLLYYGHFWSFMFLPLGMIRATTLFFQYYFFGTVSEKLSTRLRVQSFLHLMKQPCQFFDDPRHSALKLSIRLNTDASNVKAAVDARLGNLILTCTSIIIAVISSASINWKMTLQMALLCPFLFVAEYFYAKMHQIASKEDSMCFENSNKVTIEAIDHIRTVRSLNIENRIMSISIDHLKTVISKNCCRSIIQGLGCGMAYATFCFVYAVAMKLGTWLAMKREIYPNDIYRIVMCLAMTANTSGSALIYVPDYKKAIRAAALIFKLFTYPATMSWESGPGSNHISDGNIEADNVHFNYGETTVLNGVNLRVASGKSLALVGPSGCGKSTIIALLERFYHISDGILKVDNSHIEDIDIQTLRSGISLVSQEPVLFNLTIKENLLYGLTRSVRQFEIEKALKTANAYNFCTNFPNGLDTIVGERGAQLSGGQKQRIAIARAILRNPKILLLDEATSALDTESEKIVQEALNNASKQLTTIIVAHRLSTIANADSIAVLKNGVVAEQGTHDELLRMNGIYTNLVQKSRISSTPKS